jgi:hypothetical protein
MLKNSWKVGDGIVKHAGESGLYSGSGYTAGGVKLTEGESSIVMTGIGILLLIG